LSFITTARRGTPLFIVFFVWAMGTGSMQLARPLFAASFGVSVFFVALVSASNALARLVAAPITGFLTDRFGRRPLIILGVFLRGATAFGSYYATNYETFLVLEFIGGIGISVFNTGSTIIIADISGEGNRGRAVALRSMSSRLGTVSGPFVGGIIAAMFDLRSIFLFNGLSKLFTLLLILFMIRETRPEAATAGRQVEQQVGRQADDASLGFRIFLTKKFMAVILATLTISMAGGGGAFGALFPLHAQAVAGLSTSDVANMISLAGLVALLVTFPNGVLVDKLGRKATLVPALFLLGVGCYQLALINNSLTVLLAVVTIGIAEGASMGTSQVYSMDLAPEGRRGAFIGIWSLFQNGGGLLAPLMVGLIAETFGFVAAFTTIAVCLAASAAFLWIFGPETGGRQRAAEPPPVGQGLVPRQPSQDDH